MVGQFPGNDIWKLSTAKYCYLRVDKFPGKNAKKISITRYHYTEIALKKNFIREQLCKNETIVQNIFGYDSRYN